MTRRPQRTRTGVLLAVAVVSACAAVVFGAMSSGASPPSRIADAGRLDVDGVTVVLQWRAREPNSPLLVATFTPDQAGFHLYGQSLPPDGVDGVGRPTRLDVGDGARAAGPVTADRAERLEPLPGVHRPVPMYPAGPVTLTVPVQVAPGQRLHVWVSYAACSGDVCLPPVTRRPVALAPPVA